MDQKGRSRLERPFWLPASHPLNGSGSPPLNPNSNAQLNQRGAEKDGGM